MCESHNQVVKINQKYKKTGLVKCEEPCLSSFEYTRHGHRQAEKSKGISGKDVELFNIFVCLITPYETKHLPQAGP